MLKRITGWSAMVALTAALVTMPAATANAQQHNPNRNRLEVPIAGTAAGVGTVAGTFAISRFAIQDNQLVAIGALTATVTNTAGVVVRTIVTQVAMPVANATGGGPAEQSCGGTADAVAACDILNLVLGPLHLDLLGLVVDLNQVVLNITGTTGAGDLLGNLLCTITGLLDANSLGSTLVNLLNQLVGILAGL